MMIERQALEIMFNDLQQEKRELKDNYRRDLAEMEKRQFDILDRLQRLDDWDRSKEEKEQALVLGEAAATAEATKRRLGVMKLPKGFTIASLKKKQQEPTAEATTEETAPPAAEADRLDALAAAAPMAEALVKAVEEAGEVPEPGKPAEGIFTGVKENADGTKRYQLYYICSNKRCGHKGKRFITPQTIQTFCHDCGRQMKVKPATEKGWPEQDSWNNFFVAGEKKPEHELAAAYAATYLDPVSKIDKALENYNKNYEQERAALQEKEKAAAQPSPRPGKAAAAPIHDKKEQPAKQPIQPPGNKAAHSKKPRKMVKTKEAIAAIEAILEEKGRLKIGEIEKELKERHGWEWNHFASTMTGYMKKDGHDIIKDYHYYTLIPRKKAEKNGQNNLQQEKATV